MLLQLVHTRIFWKEFCEILRLAECIEVDKYRVTFHLPRIFNTQMVRIGEHRHNLLLDILWLLCKIDAVAKRLTHLCLTVDARQTQTCAVFRKHDLWIRQCLAIYGIELVYDFLTLLDHWHLILANRYVGCTECCDIGCLTDWVAEETNRDACLEVTHLDLCLYSRVTLHTGNGNEVHIIECKLGQFRNHRLDEDRCLLRIKSACEVIECNLHDVLTYLLRVLCIICECLCVRDHDIDLIIDTRILKFHTLFQRAYIMSNMQTSCRTIAS